MSLEKDLSGAPLLICSEVNEQGQRITQWTDLLRSMRLERNRHYDDIGESVGEIHRNQYRREAIERFITFMGHRWEPRRWSSIPLSKEGFRKGVHCQMRGQRWLEGEAYWQVRKAMQHDVPTEVVLDEGDIQQPHIDAMIRTGYKMTRYDPRDVAIMYRM